MKLSATHLKRYREIVRLLWKYGRSDLARQMAADAEFDAPDPDNTDAPADAKPEQLADDLEAMGPTYVKLGQVLAGRPDLLPEGLPQSPRAPPRPRQTVPLFRSRRDRHHRARRPPLQSFFPL